MNDEYDDDVLICLDKKPEGYYLNEDGFYKNCFESCKSCYGKGNKEDHNCSICETNYSFINESLYNNNCYEKCEYYYYFNESNEYFCTENCSGVFDKTIPEKNKCVNKCQNDSIYKYEYNKICYSQCPNNTYYNEEKGICIEEKYLATTYIINESTNRDYNLVEATSLKNNITNIDFKDSSNNYINQSDKEISQFIFITEINYKTNLAITGNNVEIYQGIISNILKNDLIKEEEIIFKGEDNRFFHITNSQNELDLLKGVNNKTNNFSIIDLGECQNILKEYYHINKNVSLLIIKFEKVTDVSYERSLQYEVYEPYNKTKLNLSICNNMTIDIYIPVILSEELQNLYEELKDMGYNLFDINSPFYQDICTPYKSSNGTDVPLTDRINFFYNNEETSCQSNCKFSDYMMESKYLKCNCDIQNSEINTEETTKFSAKSIYQSFFSVLKYSNYKVLKCNKLVFTLNSLTRNIGSILTIIYFLIFFVFWVIYILKGINQLKRDVSKIVSENSENKDKIEIKYIGDHKQKINNEELIKIKEKVIINDKRFKDLKNKQNNQPKNKKRENIILRKHLRKKKLSQIIKFTYPPKKTISNYNELEFDSKNKINNSNNKYNNNDILITNKRNSLNYIDKDKEKSIINKEIFNALKIDEKEKEQLDNYDNY